MTDETGLPEFWAIQYLLLPEDLREAGLRATALNFCCGPEGILKDYEKEFPKVLALLKGMESASVMPFKPKAVPDDASG